MEEVWLVLKYLPYQARYRLYAYWKVCFQFVSSPSTKPTPSKRKPPF